MKYPFFISLLFISSSISLKAQNVAFDREILRDSLVLHARNKLYAPINISIKLKSEAIDFINYQASFTLGPKDTLLSIARIPLSAIKNTANIPLGNWLQIKGTLGDPSLNLYEADYNYALPFPTPHQYEVIQGFKGKFTHSDAPSKYAIDFDLAIGDTVCAARAGIVALVVEKYKEHGGKKLIAKANKVVIYHEDGTFAYYVHFDHLGALVKEGEKVQKGQAIGLSGWTGFSTRPHLHFVVREGNGDAIPIFFQGYGKRKLKEGKTYGHQ